MPALTRRSFALGVDPKFDDPAWLNPVDSMRLTVLDIASPEYSVAPTTMSKIPDR